ncbi:hypothetical protein DFP72DRAFT_824271, partial [Ephemerocybe angulata]
LIDGALRGVTTHSLSISPASLSERMLNDFHTKGGRTFRGTVRHIREIIEGGVTSFARPNLDDIQYLPDAIIVCVGLGARFLGGVEDTNVFPTRIPIVKLRAPWVDVGRVIYNEDLKIDLSVIPLGDGDLVISGTPVDDDWRPTARSGSTEELIQKALSICPEIADAQPTASREDVRSLVVYEGSDIFGTRRNGPRLDVEWAPGVVHPRKVPVIMNYGYGSGELQASKGIAIAVVSLLQAALEQELEARGVLSGMEGVV